MQKQKVELEDAAAAFITASFDLVDQEWDTLFDAIDKVFPTSYKEDGEAKGLFAVFVMAYQLIALRMLAGNETASKVSGFIIHTFSQVGDYFGHRLEETYQQIRSDLDALSYPPDATDQELSIAYGSVLFNLFKHKFFLKTGDLLIGDLRYVELLGSRAKIASVWWESFLKDYELI